MSSLPVGLSKKDAESFRLMCDCYDKGQHVKALKHADDILRSSPDNGDTLAMKGLILSQAPLREGGNKAEGERLLKLGLIKAGMKTFVSWHCYALFHRAEKNYPEAGKCYKNALKYAPDNAQVLHDLGSMQAHARDFSGLVETRRKLMKIGVPSLVKWMELVSALHLNHELSEAERICGVAIERQKEKIDQFMKENAGAALEKNRRTLGTVKNGWLESRYILSQMHLYKALIMEEQNHFRPAWEYLEQNNAEICDKYRLWNTQARLLLKNKEFAEAEKAFRKMCDINPECYGYLSGLIASHFKTTEVNPDSCVCPVLPPECTYDDMKKFLKEEIAAKYPKSHVVKSLLLEWFQGDDFKSELSSLLCASFKKGVPTMFNVLEPIVLSTKEKSDMTAAVINEIVTSLEKDSKLPNNSEEVVLPTCLFIAYLFAARFHACYDKDDNDRKVAMEYIKKAEKHTPTAVELYMDKAEVLSVCGAVKEAAEAAEHARKLDLADRYLNNFAALMQMRAGDLEEGLETVSLFLKDDYKEPLAAVDAVQNIQVEDSIAGSCEVLGNEQKEVCVLMSILNVYERFFLTTFDYNYFAFVKNSFMSHKDLLSFGDRIPEMAYFHKSVVRLVDILLREDKHRKEDASYAAKEEEAYNKCLDEIKEREEKRKAAEDAIRSKGQDKKKKDSDDDLPPVEPTQKSNDEGMKLFLGPNPIESACNSLKPVLVNLRNKRVELKLPAYVFAAAARAYAAAGKTEEAATYLQRAKDIDAACHETLRADLVVKGKEAVLAAIDVSEPESFVSYSAALHAAVDIVDNETLSKHTKSAAEKVSALICGSKSLEDCVRVAKLVFGCPAFGEDSRKIVLDACKKTFTLASIFDVLAEKRQ